MSDMNKSELIEKMAKESGHPKQIVKEILDCLIDTITSELKEEGEVKLIGFGTFKTVNRKSRSGYNPATGAKMEIPEKVAPKFEPGTTLKQLVGNLR